MLLLSIGLWCVVVYSLKAAVWGNPLYLHLVRTDPDLIAHAERITMRGNMVAATDAELRFIRRFSHLALLEMLVFLLEMGLLSWLWVTKRFEWVAFGLLVKNVLMVAVSALTVRATAQNALFASLLALPVWLVWVDRFSALLSGIGCGVLFLAVNDIRLW